MSKPWFVVGRSWFARGWSFVRSRFAVAETDSTLAMFSRRWKSSDRDRYPYDRGEILEQSLEAWRTNPIARRIIGLTTQYVVGAGVEIGSRHRKTDAFLKRFWNHPLNHMPVRIMEWCDELSRTGNLFILVSTDAAGMSYVRAIPAAQVESIQSQVNDIEQPLSFTLKADVETMEQKVYPAYDKLNDTPWQPVILHYAINRPAGGQWGEPDLAPLLKWLSRYSNWLEDRARLNRYRNSFLFVVRGQYLSDAQRVARQNQFNASPPAPGSILVTDSSEEWEVMSPKLESSDANEDGLALKKMIATGAGVPLHFLAEPESSTRATAEAAGGPSYRHFEQRQQFFLWVIQDLLTMAVSRASQFDRLISAGAEITVEGADISARDNVALATASASILPLLASLRDRQMIDDREFLRMAYRFSGEPVNVEDMLERGRQAGTGAAPPSGAGPGDAAADGTETPSKDRALVSPDGAL